MIGRRYGKLVISGGGEKKGHLLCQCDCGTVKEIYKHSLFRGMSKSCGCNRVKHGETKTSLFKIWNHMLERCYNPNHVHYQNYGGRGITVCDKWKSSFLAFKEDVGTRPSKAHTIDRIENNGNYEPENVKWSTWKEQNNNKRNCVLITLGGVTRNVSQWAEHLGVDRHKIYHGIRSGLTPEQSILRLA